MKGVNIPFPDKILVDAADLIGSHFASAAPTGAGLLRIRLLDGNVKIRFLVYNHMNSVLGLSSTEHSNYFSISMELHCY